MEATARPHARHHRLLAGLAAAMVLLSGCGGGEADPEPAAQRTTPTLQVDRRQVTPVLASRYGPGYWTPERLAKLDDAKARFRPPPPPPTPSPTPRPTPSLSPALAPTASPSPSPSPTPTSDPPPEPDPWTDDEPPPDDEPPGEEESVLVLGSWGCEWSEGDDGLRGAACTGEITEGEISEWSCFEQRAWGEPAGAAQSCSGRVAGADLAWSCAWTDTMACALDDGGASWTCTWGGSWGECSSDDPEDEREAEGWFCGDFRYPGEPNVYICDGFVNAALPMSALALPGLWRLPD